MRLYTCKECQRSFSRTNTLANHIRTHTGEKPFACTLCERVFRNAGNLKTHIRTHTGERPFKCSFCDKRFSQHGSLKAHIRIHTKERPYVCEICQKSFRVQNNLKKHLVVHSQDSPFNCEYCNKGFKLKSDLKRHIKNVHCTNANLDAITFDSNNVITDDSTSSNILGYLTDQSEIKHFSSPDSPLQSNESHNLQNYGSDILSYAIDQSEIKNFSNLDASAFHLNENLIKVEQDFQDHALPGEETFTDSYVSTSQFNLGQPAYNCFSMIPPLDVSYINVEPREETSPSSYYVPLTTLNMEELKSFTDLTNLQQM